LAIFSNVKGWTFLRLAALAEEDETHDFVTPMRLAALYQKGWRGASPGALVCIKPASPAR
jgi:hypothetical protein